MKFFSLSKKKKLLMCELFEEVCPFIVYFLNSKKLLAKASNKKSIENSSSFFRYKNLDSDTINTRLVEEHERAKLIDEKTIKFILALTISFTLLSGANTYLSKSVENDAISLFATTTSGISLFYMLFAGLIALGALKTLPTYGYGTEYFIQLKDDIDTGVRALLSQEIINCLRHIRNEATFQCLRNGWIFLLISFALKSVSFFCDIDYDLIIEN